MNQAIIYSVLSGLCWGAAPLIMRSSAMGSWMMAIMISVGSMLTMLPIIPSQNFAGVGMRTIMIGLVAGVVNGIGMIMFYKLVAGASQGLWDFGQMAPITYVLLPIAIACGAYFFYGDTFTINKVVGLGLACGAIWFLTR